MKSGLNLKLAVLASKHTHTHTHTPVFILYYYARVVCNGRRGIKTTSETVN